MTLAGAGIAAVAGLVVGAVAIWLGHGPGNMPAAVPHLVAGWSAVLAGAWASWRVPWSRAGALLIATGMLSFAGDLSTCLNVEPFGHRCLDPNALGDLSRAASALWLGSAAHLLLTFPEGRADRGAIRGAVLVGYAAALLVPWSPGAAQLVIAAVVVCGPMARWVALGPRRRLDLRAPIAAGGALAVALLLQDALPVPLVELVLALDAVGLAAALASVHERRQALTTDRAVGLGDALAAVLGDRLLRIAYRDPRGEGWLDTAGSTTPPPAASSHIVVTRLERDGVALAAIEHDRDTLAADDIRHAVLVAVELGAHNSRLRAELAAQVTQLEKSRRRLVDAALRERRRLGQQVDHEVELPMTGLASGLEVVSETRNEAASSHLARAASELALARDEVRDLAAGLYPAMLARTGLRGALRDLADRSVVPIHLALPAEVRAGARVEATAWFLCAEAVANATRYARGANVRIGVLVRDGRLVIEVRDDGPGGADEARGTGLQGMRDRIEALAGSLMVASPPGGGTTLIASLPAGTDA